jgi:hypothetical protein
MNGEVSERDPQGANGLPSRDGRHKPLGSLHLCAQQRYLTPWGCNHDILSEFSFDLGTDPFEDFNCGR